MLVIVDNYHVNLGKVQIRSLTPLETLKRFGVTLQLVLADTELEDDHRRVIDLRSVSSQAQTTYIPLVQSRPAFEGSLPQTTLHESFSHFLKHLAVNHRVQLEDDIDMDLRLVLVHPSSLTIASSSWPSRKRTIAKR